MTAYATLLKNDLVATVSNHIDTYPTPINLSYLWGFGSLAGIALGVQIVTGVLLAMHYAPEIHLAFNSVEHIMRDVRGGVFLRYIHANGASMFFIVVYTHMFRGLYYGSYFQPRANLWYSGVVIFLLMMATAFMGYVLPWGQMSFWGATVITNLFSAIPGIGNSIVQLLWGGFSVDNPTLNRFFSLHYLLPFVIAGLAFLHLILLHQNGSNNPLGVNSIFDRVPFYPYFYVKDLFGFFIFVWVFSLFVIYAPNYMGHPDNYIEANPLVTPAHIVPEWYFLPFYAVLRTIPDKLGGVLLMVFAIAILAVLPVVDTSSFRSTFFKPLNLWFFWYFAADSVSLGWIGQEVVESPFIEMAGFVTLSYFFYFIPLLPMAGLLENLIISNNVRISMMALFSLASTSAMGNSFTKPRYIFWEIPTEVDEIFKIFSWVDIAQVGFIIFFVVMLTLFFPRSGEFTRFLNKITFGFLIFALWVGNFSITPRYSQIKVNPNYLPFDLFWDTNTFPSDDLGSTVNIPNNILEPIDSLYSHLFAFYALLIVSIFLYGISDRFFIANSYEIEFPILVLFIHIGALFLFNSESLIDFLISIEIVTLATYALTAYSRKNRFSAYAGAQYFIIGSIPSALLILGLALIYRHWGTFSILDLDLISESLTQQPITDTFHERMRLKVAMGIFPIINPYTAVPFMDPTIASTVENTISAFEVVHRRFIIPQEAFPLDLTYTANNLWSPTGWEEMFEAGSDDKTISVLALMLVFFNFLFKLTAAPFHFWAPSVYGKSPLASVTFLSIFSKAMIFFALIKIFVTFFAGLKFFMIPFLMLCSILSVLFGMVGAFTEKVIKRFFVYSSMGHVGFILIAISIGTAEGMYAAFHYIPVYIITSFIMWFIVMHMGTDKNQLTHFATLRNSDPLLALIFSLIIFSMSGIPPLGGFFVKFDVLAALMSDSKFYTNYLLLLFTVASFFYYLRVVKIIFFDDSKEEVVYKEGSVERLRLISILFLILLFYFFIVQKATLTIQTDMLEFIVNNK